MVRDPEYGVADWNLHEAGRSVATARTLRRGAAAGGDRAPLATLAHGIEVDDALRDVISDAAAHGIELGDLDTEEGTHRLLEYANGPADRGAVQGVTRYLLALHGRRLDLHDTFPALEDDDGEAFVQWARTSGPPKVSRRAAAAPGAGVGPAAERPAAARRQRRRLPAHGARRRRGGAALRRGARGGAGAGAHRDRRSRPAEAEARRLRGPPAGRRVPVQSRLRQRVRAPRVRSPQSAPASSRTASRSAHWAWEASKVPDIVERGVLDRRRDLDQLGLRDQRPRERLAGPGGHAPAAGAAAARRRPAARPRARPTRSPSCSPSTSSRPRVARTRSGSCRPTRAPSVPPRARSS